MIRFILALILFATSAQAGPDRVSLLLGSHHVGARGFEETNPGLFLTWEGGVDLTVGAYRNSYGRGSVAVTGHVPVIRWKGGEAGLFAGAAWYPRDGHRFAVHAGDVVPIGGIQIRHGNAFAQVIPMNGKPVKAVISFGLTWAIEKD